MNRLRVVFLAPAWALSFVLVVLPLGLVVAYSLLTRGAYGGVFRPWTLENYQRLLAPVYAAIAFRSLWIALVSTALTIAAGFPLALGIARAGRRRALLLNLVMLPFWTSFLIRIYAWIFLLRDTGLVNTVLLASGLIRQPLPLLFNEGAVVLGLVYTYLPFAVLPLYATIEKIDPALVDAAADLGATPWRTVSQVVLPLARPGIAAALLLTFVPMVGAYLAPDLLGGGKAIMIGTLIQNQFTTARDWPFGAALSLLFIGLTLLVLPRFLKRSQAELL